MNTQMTIGAVARLTQISEKTIRFYEEAGILPAAERTDSGYRLYTSEDIRRLRLIRRARGIGVALKDIKDLVSLAFTDSCMTFEQRLMELIDIRLVAVQKEIDGLEAQRLELLSLREMLAESDEATQQCRADQCDCCRFIDR